MSHRLRIDAAVIDPLLARPEGVSVAEACEHCPGTPERSMLKRLQHLVTYAKTAYTAKVPRSLAYRWFSSEAARDAWQAAHPAVPSRCEQQQLARAQRGPSLKDRLLAAVHERGGHGTLPSDLASAVLRHSGSVGSWITDMEQRGILDSIKHKGVRICYPAGTQLNPGALQACQRRIDREMATRRTRVIHTTSTTKAEAGQPAGVTLAPRADWHATPAVNAGSVQPIICPAPRFDHRYQVDKATHVAGGFADMGPGRYDMGPSHAVAQWLGRKADASGTASSSPWQC